MPAFQSAQNDRRAGQTRGGRGMIGRALLVALFTCVTAGNASAQDSNGARIWGAVGVGAGIPTSGGDGIANMAQVVFQKHPHHIAIRGLVLHDLDRPTHDIGEASVLYGRTFRLGGSYAAIASGISANVFDTCPDDDDTCFALGVPLVAEASVSRGFIGLGVQAFGNLNSRASYAGAVVFVQFGRL
jgi:hypothetical protein